MSKQGKPKVQRGQVWAHGQLHYQVISVRDEMARCLARDTSGEPVRGETGQAVVVDFSTYPMRANYTFLSDPAPSTVSISEQANGEYTVTLSGVTRLPFTYRRPRCPMRHIRRLIRLIWRRSRRIAQIVAQSLVCGGFIGGGILIGLNPIGAFLVFGGIILMLGAIFGEEVESDEEYRQAVIAHFSERGEKPPKWTQRGAK